MRKESPRLLLPGPLVPQPLPGGNCPVGPVLAARRALGLSLGRATFDSGRGAPSGPHLPAREGSACHLCCTVTASSAWLWPLQAMLGPGAQWPSERLVPWHSQSASVTPAPTGCLSGLLCVWVGGGSSPQADQGTWGGHLFSGTCSGQHFLTPGVCRLGSAGVAWVPLLRPSP